MQAFDVETFLIEPGNLAPDLVCISFAGEDHQARLYHAIDGSSTFEAMADCALAKNTPVIGANVRALSEYIAEDRGFLVEASDFASLADRLADLFGHPDLRSRLGRGGASYVKQFATERIAHPITGIS